MDNENRYDPYYKARMDRQAIGEQIKKTKWYDIPGHLGNAGLAIGSGLNILYSNSWFDPRNYQYGDYVPEDTDRKINLKNALVSDVKNYIERYDIDENGKVVHKNPFKSLTDSFDTQSVGASDAQTIRGMSGTTRALVINFNREIVSMPTTINANDVEDIKQQLEPAIEDMIVRGLTIALNNSTRMI